LEPDRAWIEREAKSSQEAPGAPVQAACWPPEDERPEHERLQVKARPSSERVAPPLAWAERFVVARRPVANCSAGPARREEALLRDRWVAGPLMERGLPAPLPPAQIGGPMNRPCPPIHWTGQLSATNLPARRSIAKKSCASLHASFEHTPNAALDSPLGAHRF